MLFNFSGCEVGIAVPKPQANQRFCWLLLVVNQAIENLQLLLEPFHALFEKPSDGLLLLESESAQKPML